MGTRQRPLWAVTPPLDDSRSEPKLFATAEAADRFLELEITAPFKKQMRQRAKALSHSKKLQKTLDELVEKKNADRTKAIANARSEYRDLVRSSPQVLTYSRLGWRKVALDHWSDHSGRPKCNFRLRDFLPVRAAEAVTPLSLDEQYRRAEEGWSGLYEVELGEGWPLDKIHAKADRLIAGLDWFRFKSEDEAVIEITYCLADAFEDFGAPCVAVAAFWQSRWMQNWLRQSCSDHLLGSLMKHLSEQAERSFQKGKRESPIPDVIRSRNAVYERLAELAHQLRTEGPPDGRKRDKEERQALFRAYAERHPGKTRDVLLDDLAATIGKTRRAVESWLYRESRSGKQTDFAMRKVLQS